jgi:hypothetical protein
MLKEVMEAVHFQKCISFVNRYSFDMKNLTDNVWQPCCELLLS